MSDTVFCTKCQQAQDLVHTSPVAPQDVADESPSGPAQLDNGRVSDSIPQWIEQTHNSVRKCIEASVENKVAPTEFAIIMFLNCLSEYPDCHPEFRHSVLRLRRLFVEGSNAL